jgi:oligoribonuclease
MKKRNDHPKKLLWIDLEMTGLDPVKDRILEVAIIITDFEFNELETYEAVISQDDQILRNMSTWAKKNHKANGLLERVKSSERDEKTVIKEINKLVEKHFSLPAVLAGNSIHQDRRFIRHWWPQIDKKLHYRMLDVTSFKLFMQGKYGLEFKKPDEHRALEDIRGSIEELKYYLDKLPELLTDG